MSSENKVDVSSLKNVPETMLIPLYFKAKETREHGVIKDDKAVEIVEKINYNFSKLDADGRTQIGVAVRTYLFDKILNDLIKEVGNNLVVVNLGAGLDTRQERFPNVKWYQVDLPESIEIRKQFFKEGNAVLIPKSILDFTWINDIKEKENVLFIAEGLFMYFDEEEVKTVFQMIGSSFKQSFIAFNQIPKAMVGATHKSVDTEKAPMKWGTNSLQEIWDWNAGWKEKKTFFPPDYFKKRWKWMRLLGLLKSARNAFMIALLETEK